MKYDAITATNNDGNKLATLIFLPQTKLTPTQKINIEPTSERYIKAKSVINGSNKLASTVILPCNRNTGIAEKIAPFPVEQAIIIMMIKSSKDLVIKTEES